MDSSGGYDLTLCYRPSRQLCVHFSRSNDRRPHPEREPPIDEIWGQITKSNPALFNASKFRLHSVSHPAPTCAILHLGLTDYKTFQATHSCPNPLTLLGRAHMALSLGNTIIVSTRDSQTLLLIRNNSVGEGKGAIVFPGGHPEPSALDPPAREGENERIMQELFHGARREALEELFLQDDELANVKEMHMLGIVERTRDAKPTMVFLAATRLTGDEVRQAYRRGNVEQEETSNIIMKPISFLRLLAKGEGIEGTLMPETIGAARLWLQMTDWASNKE